MKTNVAPGDKVSFTHPTRGHTVRGVLVAVIDGYYMVDVGPNVPLNTLRVEWAEMFNFKRDDSEEESLSE